MSAQGQKPVVPPISSAIDNQFVTPTEDGQPLTQVANSSAPQLPESFDVRKPPMPFESMRPYGAGFGVDVTEILRRGFKQLNPEEQANVIGSYLATQKQQLAVFETADQTHEKRERLQLDVDSHRIKRVLSVITFIAIILIVTLVVGLIIYFASKGVLSDSSLFQGVFTLLQEVFRVITSGGKY